MAIISVYTVTTYKGSNVEGKYEVTVEGAGQETMKSLRKNYEKWTRFVLEGFNINGQFVPLKFPH